MAERFEAAAELAAAGENPAAREAALASILNRTNDAAIAMQIRINELEARQRESQQREARRTPLSRTRGFDKLPTFGGKESGFETWTDKVMVFFSDEKGLRLTFKAAAKETVEIGERFVEDMTEDNDHDTIDVKWYS